MQRRLAHDCESQELDIQVDNNEYTLQELNDTLRTLDIMNQPNGGLVSRGTVYGVLGFVQLWQGCYYMLVITRRRKVWTFPRLL